MKRINLYSNIASHYRKSIWIKLLENSEFNVEFYFGANKALGIESINFEEKPFSKNLDNFNHLKNIWLTKDLVVWQLGVVKSCLTDSFDKAIFLGEAYCLSTWVAAIICQIRKIEVVFWGHGLYGNEGKFKLHFRKIFYLLANKHLLYGRRAKQLMIKEGFDQEKLYVVFNSLDYDLQKKLRAKYEGISKQEAFPDLANPDIPVLIFIGRLTSAKKLDILINAVNNINEDRVKVNLVLIGDGPERAKLERLGAKGIKEKWINFVGACYEEEQISRYLSAADLCVSPGNVGLTAIHSLSYGTPVVTHNDFSNQMPEAEAIKDGYNGFFFKKDNVSDLQRKIEAWFKQSIEEEALRKQCFDIIDNFYNPNYQLNVFERLIEGEKPIV